jgi:hypothetical protein
MTTYVFALLLVWLADRLEYPRIMMRKAKAWCANFMTRAVRLLRLQKVMPDWFSDVSSTSSSFSSDLFPDDDFGSTVPDEPGTRDRVLGMFRRYLEVLKSSKKKTEACD